MCRSNALIELIYFTSEFLWSDSLCKDHDKSRQAAGSGKTPLRTNCHYCAFEHARYTGTPREPTTSHDIPGGISRHLGACCGIAWNPTRELARYGRISSAFTTNLPQDKSEPTMRCAHGMSHLTVGVALFDSNASERMSSSREKLAVSATIC